MELPILYQMKPQIQGTVGNNGRLSSPQTQQHCVCYNAFLCEKDWHRWLLNLATGKKKSADLLHFNDTAYSKREINDIVYG